MMEMTEITLSTVYARACVYARKTYDKGGSVMSVIIGQWKQESGLRYAAAQPHLQ